MAGALFIGGGKNGSIRRRGRPPESYRGLLALGAGADVEADERRDEVDAQAADQEQRPGIGRVLLEERRVVAVGDGDVVEEGGRGKKRARPDRRRGEPRG